MIDELMIVYSLTFPKKVDSFPMKVDLVRILLTFHFIAEIYGHILTTCLLSFGCLNDMIIYIPFIAHQQP